MTSLSDILRIERPCDIDVNGLQGHLLWSDPSDKCCLFAKSKRGAGYLYGREAVDLFCELNNIELIVRAHQIVEDGYELNFNRKVLTIFSAPNYCHKFTNDAGILKVSEDLKCSIVRLSVNSKRRSLYVCNGDGSPGFQERACGNPAQILDQRFVCGDHRMEEVQMPGGEANRKKKKRIGKMKMEDTRSRSRSLPSRDSNGKELSPTTKSGSAQSANPHNLKKDQFGLSRGLGEIYQGYPDSV
jgi:protein phosphatase